MRIFLSFYRPIPLLQCDYKIVAKCLANRAKKVLPMIIHRDQSCSIPGRTISNNCHLLRNVIDYCEMRNIAACILGCDQMKAFDRVEFDYLFKVLEAFGFGHGFIKWIRVLYNDCTCQVLVNGHLTDPYQIMRGIRQGCPLSSILYVLCIEPLCHKIRANPSIKGIQPPTGPEIKLSAYADDSNPIVTDIPSIGNVFSTFKRFGEASGGKLNLSKSTGTLLGAAKRWSLPDDLFGIQWVPFSKTLGCQLGTCNIYKENWDPIVESVTKQIKSQNSRVLSLRGKAIVVNSKVLSKLWYVGKIFILPDIFLQPILTSIFADFIWKKKYNREYVCEKIARNTLYLHPADGGIGLVNIQLKLKAFRILHVIDFIFGEEHPWKDFASFWIGLGLRRFNEDRFTNASPHSFDRPLFYKTAFLDFLDFQSKHPDITLFGLTSKRVYDILLDDVGHVTNIAQENPHINYDLIFTSCDDKHYCPQVRCLTYQTAHEVVRTRQWLHQKKPEVYRDPSCPCCRSYVETLDHLFFKCPIVSDVWSVVQDFMYGLCNHRLKICRALVIYNLYPPVLNKRDLFIAKQVVGYAKRAIYHMRMQLCNSMVRPYNGQELLFFFLALLKSRVRADNYRLPDNKFRKLWCHKNVICAKSGNSMEFTFSSS